MREPFACIRLIELDCCAPGFIQICKALKLGDIILGIGQAHDRDALTQGEDCSVVCASNDDSAACHLLYQHGRTVQGISPIGCLI